MIEILISFVEIFLSSSAFHDLFSNNRNTFKQKKLLLLKTL